MSAPFHVVVCGSLVPDPLQTLEPVTTPAGPGLKNEALLPSVLDPWAAHALYEAANLARQVPGSKVWLLCLGPKAKLQQLMMTLAQKAAFELVVLDGSASGFTDAGDVAAVLADAIAKLPGLDRQRLLVFGGCASAARDAGVTLPMVGERLGIVDQFMAVDELKVQADGSLRLLERLDGGCYQASELTGPPAVLAWATGSLPIPPNNPQVGMQNMRTIMPALQKATPAPLPGNQLKVLRVDLPKQVRATRVVKDLPLDDMARELVTWIKQ